MRRPGRVAVAAGLLGLALVVSPHGAVAAQQRTVRFEIIAVSDTTLSFRSGDAHWVRRDQTGSAVDPRRRDALVARFRVVRVRNGVATALVTGQTTAVSTDHVATLREPPRSWFRAPTFWAGLLVGGALGATAALVR